MQHPLSWQSLVELIICFENARESDLGLDKKIPLCLFTSQKNCAYSAWNGKQEREKKYQRHGNESWVCQIWECQCLITKVLSEEKKIVRCLEKCAYMWAHLVIRYSFVTHAHIVSVILFSDMLPAQSFVFLNSFLWSLNYFILPTRASNLLSLVLHK